MDERGYPKVAVILVNWNGHLLTRVCVNSLRQCHYPNYYVIIVDNGSDERSFLYLQEHCPGTILIRNEKNLGFTGGNNTGMLRALDEGCDLIMLLNNDTVVDPDFFGPLVRAIRQPQVGAVQPKIYYEGDRRKIWNAGGTFNDFLGLSKTVGVGQEDRGQFDERLEVDWITGCCMLLRSEAILEVGMLDDCFFAYHEDVDWSLRLRDHGFTLIFEPQAVIYHSVSSSSKSRDKGKEGFVAAYVHFLNIRNRTYLVRKHYGGLSLVAPYLMLVAWVFGLFFYFLLRRRIGKARAVIKGFIEGHRLCK